MYRDFSESTKGLIYQELDRMNQWDNWEVLSNFISNLLYKIIAFFCRPKKETDPVKLYYRTVTDANDMAKGLIYNIFSAAWDEDKKSAGKVAKVNNSAERLLEMMKMLTEHATPEGLLTVPAYCAVIQDGWEKQILDKTVLKNSVAGFQNVLYYVSDWSAFLSDFDVWLMAILNIGGITIDQLFYSQSMESVKAKLIPLYIESILSGTEGCISINDIAKELNVSPQEVKEMLQKKNQKYSPLDLDNRELKIDYMYWDRRLDEIIDRELDRIVRADSLDEIEGEFLAKILEEENINPNLLEKLKDGSADGYAVEQKRTVIMKTIAEACDREKPEVYPKEWEKLYDSVDKNEYKKVYDSLKKISGTKDDPIIKETENYLLSVCKSKESVKHLKTIFELSEKAGKGFESFDEYMTYAQKGGEAIDYLFSDYEAEMEMLETISNNIDPNCVDADYLAATERLKYTYSNKMGHIFEEIFEEAGKKGIEKIADIVTGHKMLDIVLDSTGVSKVENVNMSLFFQQDNCRVMYDQYSNAISQYLALDEPSYEQTQSVKFSFSAMREAYEDYYETLIDKCDGYAFDIGSDKKYKAYLQYEYNKITKLEFGDSFEALTYEQYNDMVNENSVGGH